MEVLMPKYNASIYSAYRSSVRLSPTQMLPQHPVAKLKTAYLKTHQLGKDPKTICFAIY